MQLVFTEEKKSKKEKKKSEAYALTVCCRDKEEGVQGGVGREGMEHTETGRLFSVSVTPPTSLLNL